MTTPDFAVERLSDPLLMNMQPMQKCPKGVLKNKKAQDAADKKQKKYQSQIQNLIHPLLQLNQKEQPIYYKFLVQDLGIAFIRTLNSQTGNRIVQNQTDDDLKDAISRGFKLNQYIQASDNWPAIRPLVFECVKSFEQFRQNVEVLIKKQR